MIVDCAVYRDGARHPGHLDLDEAYAASREPGCFVWIGLYEPTADEFASVQKEFDLHELAVEDAVKAHQRPKLERYGDSVLMVLKTARYVDPVEVIEFGEILLFAGPSFVVVVRHGQASALHDVRAALERDVGAMKMGPGAVLHAIDDPVLAGVDTDIQEVEEQVFSDLVPPSSTIERVYKLKREVLEFHRATWPLIDPFSQMAAGRHPEAEGVEEYFRDVHDHLLRVNEQIDSFRDLLTSVLQANLALVAVRQNADMRRISSLVGVAAVPTVIGAIYGMNFAHMPELTSPWGYPLALLAIVVGCAGTYLYFHRRGWL